MISDTIVAKHVSMLAMRVCLGRSVEASGVSTQTDSGSEHGCHFECRMSIVSDVLCDPLFPIACGFVGTA